MRGRNDVGAVVGTRQRFNARDAAAVAAFAVRRPETLVALGLLVLNDHLFKARWPGAVTGKLSDIVWPIVAVPLAALLLAPLAQRAGRERWALAATVLTAAPFVAVNVSPAAADLASRVLTGLVGPSVVTVDPSDLLTLPVFLLPRRWLRHDAVPAPRPAGRVGPLGLVVLGLATLGTAATSCHDDRPRVSDLGLDEDGHLIALVDGGLPALARSRDGGETWDRDPRGPTSWSDEPGAAFTATIERLRTSERRTEACGVHDCFRLEPHESTIERTAGGTLETLTLADPHREVATRRELNADVCAHGYSPHSGDLEVITSPDGGDRAVVARGLEGVVLVDGEDVRPVAVLEATPAGQQGRVLYGVIEPELVVVSLISVAAWLLGSAVWWAALRTVAVERGAPPRRSNWPRFALVTASLPIAAVFGLLGAIVSGPGVGTVRAAAVVGLGVGFAWLVVPTPDGWTSVPLRLALHVALPSFAVVAVASAWAVGFPRSYPVMLVTATVLAVGAFEIARRVAPLPSTRDVSGLDDTVGGLPGRDDVR